MGKRVIVLHATDNVATAMADLEAGDIVEIGATTITAREKVPFGHKIALGIIAAGAPVTKYGEQIGLATHEITAGSCVHVHNVDSQRGRGDRAMGAAK